MVGESLALYSLGAFFLMFSRDLISLFRSFNLINYTPYTKHVLVFFLLNVFFEQGSYWGVLPQSAGIARRYVLMSASGFVGNSLTAVRIMLIKKL